MNYCGDWFQWHGLGTMFRFPWILLVIGALAWVYFSRKKSRFDVTEQFEAKCPKCASQTHESWVYCPKCGEKL